MQALLNITLLFGLLINAPVNYEATTNLTASQTVWPEELNTASKVVYLTDFEKRVIFELNKVKSNPAKYATEYLEPLLSAYDGLIFNYPGETPLKTVEGVAALEDCIKTLKAAAPSPALLPSKGLSSAARLLVNDQKQYGGSGHLTKSGWTTEVRIKRYGSWQNKLSENLVYGYDDPRQAVISLLIDDGVSNRAHRISILSGDFTKVGVSADTHPEYRYFSVVELTGDFIESGR